ncbi:MAG: carbohydrate ABC transporter permease [Pseudoprimorskyibacter sp.]|nr:carbohydrate ABC transporter permease [Pseudoprimorskyibacter sp.]
MIKAFKPYRQRPVIPLVYAIFVFLPLYWLVIISFMTQDEATSGLSFFPKNPTVNNYLYILTDPGWTLGFVNAAIYSGLNVLLSLAVAIPAAYAFSRYQFLGDKHLFFWFLASRMTPSAVLFLPLIQLYSEVGLMDKVLGVALAHCMFTVPVAVWILEGFFKQIPPEIDETSKIDGRGWISFAVKILIPVAAPGIGVAAFFCFMASWVELILANALTTTEAKPIVAVLFRAGGPLGFVHLPILCAAGVLTIIPGLGLVYFVRHYLATGLSMGRVKRM